MESRIKEIELELGALRNEASIITDEFEKKNAANLAARKVLETEKLEIISQIQKANIDSVTHYLEKVKCNLFKFKPLDSRSHYTYKKIIPISNLQKTINIEVEHITHQFLVLTWNETYESCGVHVETIKIGLMHKGYRKELATQLIGRHRAFSLKIPRKMKASFEMIEKFVNYVGNGN